MRNCIIFIAIITALYTPLSLLDYNHFPYSDGAEHGAAVRELAMHLTRPSDPMLANHPGKSPRFVPSILIMALTMRLTGLDVLTVLKLFLPLFFLLFLCAAALFTKEYFDDSGQASWSLAALLFLWGTGWMGANAYMFSALLYTAYFPSLVTFSLSLLALYFQLRFLKTRNRVSFIIQLLLGSIAFINHPPTGIFLLTCSGLLYLEQKTPLKAATFYYSISVTGALLISLLWPYYDFLPNLLKITSGEMAGTTDYSLTRHYLYQKPLLRSGPALMGIPPLLLFAAQRRYLLLVGGAMVFCGVYILGFFFNISLAERFIFFIVCILQLAFSRTCREWFPGFRSRSSLRFKTASGWFLVILLIAGAAIQAVLVYKEFILPAFIISDDHRSISYRSPNRMQRELGRYLQAGDVVLSDLYTSWSVPVYTGAKIIALYHSAPHVRDNRERVQALETFFNAATSVEERTKIIEKYGVTHVLLNFKIGGKEIEPAVRGLGLQVIERNESMCLFSVPPRR